MGCFDDCTECCFAYWCFPFYVCSLFPRNSENLCSCVFGGLVPLRTKIRTERAIQVSVFYYTLKICVYFYKNEFQRDQFVTIGVLSFFYHFVLLFKWVKRLNIPNLVFNKNDLIKIRINLIT